MAWPRVECLSVRTEVTGVTNDVMAEFRFLGGFMDLAPDFSFQPLPAVGKR